MKSWLIAVILTYLFLLFFGSFIAVGFLLTGKQAIAFPEAAGMEQFLYYFLAGAIGGSLRHLYMFCTHYMKDELQNQREWIMYIFYPLFATGTAVIAVTLIESGILFIEFTNHNEDHPYAEISIAFFIGFGFNRFLAKLNKVSENMFDGNKNNSK
ncbi:hypothetical protein ACQCT5_04175 [Sutcliffiella halmapala]